MKVNDVRLIGCQCILFPVSRKEGVSGELMYLILVAIYKKVGILDSKGSWHTKSFEIQKQNPGIPTQFEEKDFGEEVGRLRLEGLIDKQNNLTEKAINVLEEVAKRQQSLKKPAIENCPCKGRIF